MQNADNRVSFTGWGDARPAPTDEGSNPAQLQTDQSSWAPLTNYFSGSWANFRGVRTASKLDGDINDKMSMEGNIAPSRSGLLIGDSSAPALPDGNLNSGEPTGNEEPNDPEAEDSSNVNKMLMEGIAQSASTDEMSDSSTPTVQRGYGLNGGGPNGEDFNGRMMPGFLDLDRSSTLSGALSIGENNQAESHNQQGERVLRTPTKHARQPEPRIQVRFTTEMSLPISPTDPGTQTTPPRD
jgi:hypothetical protein